MIFSWNEMLTNEDKLVRLKYHRQNDYTYDIVCTLADLAILKVHFR